MNFDEEDQQLFNRGSNQDINQYEEDEKTREEQEEDQRNQNYQIVWQTQNFKKKNSQYVEPELPSNLVCKLITFLIVIFIFMTYATVHKPADYTYRGQQKPCQNQQVILQNDTNIIEKPLSSDQKIENNNNFRKNFSEENVKQEITVLNQNIEQVELFCKNGKYLYEQTCLSECPSGFSIDQDDSTCKRDYQKKYIQRQKALDTYYQIITPKKFDKSQINEYNLVFLFHGYQTNYNFFQTQTNVYSQANLYKIVFISINLEEKNIINPFNTIKVIESICQQEFNCSQFKSVGLSGYDIGGTHAIKLSTLQNDFLQFQYAIVASPTIVENSEMLKDCDFKEGGTVAKFLLSEVQGSISNAKIKNHCDIFITGGKNDSMEEFWGKIASNKSKNSNIEIHYQASSDLTHSTPDLIKTLNYQTFPTIGHYINQKLKTSIF